MRSGFGREYGLCKRMPGGVGDWDAGGVKDFVRGWREALLCLSSTSRLDCHLSGMSCSCICSSWPWLRKEQSSEVRRYSCSLTPTVHRSFVSSQRPLVPSECTARSPACMFVCCTFSPLPALCSAFELQGRTVKTTSPKNNLLLQRLENVTAHFHMQSDAVGV